MKKLLFAACAMPMLWLTACKKNNDTPTSHTVTGSTVKMGNGTARTWMETDEQNHPKTLSITFGKDAFTNLPTTDGTEYILPLPTNNKETPFNHVGINWNPHGHPPEHVYDKPHFDFHFYTIGVDEQMAIPAYEQDSARFLNFPGPAYLPANYVPIPGGEPMMGTHWVDVTSPELSQTNPQPFTQTFIYGSFNGGVIFYEPMITLDFITNTQTFSRDIPQPAKVSSDGYYPTKMSFTHKDDGSVDLMLSGFVYRAKS